MTQSTYEFLLIEKEKYKKGFIKDSDTITIKKTFVFSTEHDKIVKELRKEYPEYEIVRSKKA
jgi:hypothetical protein